MDDHLPVHLDTESGVPIYVQLEEQIHLMIRRGVLTAGAPLPTVRGLAVELGINANTVARVYRDLQRDGVLTLRRGIGTFVADEPPGTLIEPRALDVIARQVSRLIHRARESGLSVTELSGLVEALWEEESDADR